MGKAENNKHEENQMAQHEIEGRFFKPVPGTRTLDGWKIDGSKVRFFGGKKQAELAAKSIGWPLSSVEKAYTRFQYGWVLSAGYPGFLSPEGFGDLYKGANPKGTGEEFCEYRC